MTFMCWKSPGDGENNDVTTVLRLYAIVGCNIIINLIFVICWFIVGIILYDGADEYCKEHHYPIWILGIIKLTFYGLFILTHFTYCTEVKYTIQQ